MDTETLSTLGFALALVVAVIAAFVPRDPAKITLAAIALVLLALSLAVRM